MTQITVQDLAARIPETIERIRRGEEVLIADAEGPIAKIVSVDRPANRGFGLMKGQIWISNDFNDPLSDEELRNWGK